MAMSILFAGQLVCTNGTAARFYYGHMDSIYLTYSSYSIYCIHSIYSIYCAYWRHTSFKMN